MQPRRLGRTGRVVGAIGASTCGIASYRGVDAAGARRALAHAIELGVDLIDTAAEPDLERLVGEVVRELRAHHRVTIASTVVPAAPPPALDTPEGTVRAPTRTSRVMRVLAPVWVQAAVEQTLLRSRLEVVPIAVIAPWFDDWLDDEAWPELCATLERLIYEGKVLHWGVAAADPADAVRAAADPAFAVVATEHNLFDRRAEAALIPAARAHDTGVIVRAPLAGGGLGGELGPGARLRADDARARAYPPERLAELAIKLAQLAEHIADPPPAAAATDAAREALELALARRRAGPEVEARTIAELAIRACLTRVDLAALAIGMRTREHVDANVGLADGRALSAALLARLE